MDDRRFDDIIRRKVSEFEPQGFDSSALAALRYQLGAVQALPWHSRYRTEIVIVTGMVISTILILWMMWLMNSSRLEWEKADALIDVQKEQIDILTKEVHALKASPPDTIHVSVQGISTQMLLNRIVQLEWIIEKQKALTGFEARQGYAMLVPRSVSAYSFYAPRASHHALPVYGSERSCPAVATENKANKKKLSTHTLRALEKHYYKGIGIRLGPAVELSKGFYTQGAGRIDYGGGLLMDFIVSPSLSFETGAKFTHRFYEVSEEELDPAVELPYVNPDLGPIISADVDSWLVEVPLNLKHRVPLSIKTQWTAAIGYSHRIITKQIFEYDYRFGQSGSMIVNESHTHKNPRTSTGSLNLSLGLSKELKNKKRIESTVYYQYGLREYGKEKTNSNFIGVRSSYWFTLR